MIEATINGKTVRATPGTTILEAAGHTGVHIPTLCKHPDLPASAGCGICVVKVFASGRDEPSFQRACSTPLAADTRIVTQDPQLASIRRTVVQLILSNHPNECLTCGRNGTCELQKVAEDFGIRVNPFEQIVPDLPGDDSTRTIVLDPRKCIKCGRCITVCQDHQDVWALSFLDRGLETRISPAGDIALADSPCIRCGQCSAHCPTGAIFEYNEVDTVWDMLMDESLHCVCQIAPAVRVSLGEGFGFAPGENLTHRIYAALRRLGFAGVFDTNIGADITIMEEAHEFVRRLRDGTGPLPMITTCCPSWVDFMEKFHSDMIPHFSSCKSPHAIVGTLSKTHYAAQAGIDPESIRMVSMMPCTAKKYEIVRSKEMYASGRQDVDVSLTTRELIRMVRQAGLELGALPDEPADSPLGEYSGAGTIFGASGGVMEAALRTAHFLLTGEEMEELEFSAIRGLQGVKQTQVDIGGREIRLAVAQGLGNVEDVLDRVRSAAQAGSEPPYHFIEVMACPGGCIGGGGQAWGVTDEVRRKRAEGLLADDRMQTARRSHQNPAVAKLYKDFLGEPLGDRAHELLHTQYKPRPEYRR